jgi:hypothetical protein
MYLVDTVLILLLIGLTGGSLYLFLS